MSAQLIMLGTGSAFPRHSYNSCFVIKAEDFTLLSDAGGGNGIFKQLERANISTDEITHFVISHAHTDHILGAVWIIRARINAAKNGQDLPSLVIYANRSTATALKEICRYTLLPSHFAMIDKIAAINIIDSPVTTPIGTSIIQFFDVCSENVEQLGFKLTLPDGVSLVSLGDEALTPSNCNFAQHADYLICGAFCRYGDRDIFRPYEKHHLTVKDVTEVADKCDIKHLILYHSDDATPDKKQKYTEEASSYYSGKVIIPADLDVIDI